jgi:hypothetical protein
MNAELARRLRMAANVLDMLIYREEVAAIREAAALLDGDMVMVPRDKLVLVSYVGMPPLVQNPRVMDINDEEYPWHELRLETTITGKDALRLLLAIEGKHG